MAATGLSPLGGRGKLAHRFRIIALKIASAALAELTEFRSWPMAGAST
jgi:hypothetical protein